MRLLVSSFLMKFHPVYCHVKDFKEYFLFFKYAKLYQVIYCTILKITFLKILFSFEESTSLQRQTFLTENPYLHKRTTTLTNQGSSRSRFTFGFLTLSRASPWSCPRFYFLPFLFLAGGVITQTGSRGW